MDSPEGRNDEPQDLRVRRKAQTRVEISDAALRLFEERGLNATTVDDIARAAGVSPRTFFRYFPTKEHSLFVDDEDFDAVMQAVRTALREGSPVVATLDGAWMHLFRELEANPDAHARSLRVRRVVHGEPALLALALAREKEGLDRLAEAAASGDSTFSPLATRALVAAVNSAVQVAYNEWMDAMDRGADASPVALYAEARSGLLAYSGGPEGA